MTPDKLTNDSWRMLTIEWPGTNDIGQITPDKSHQTNETWQMMLEKLDKVGPVDNRPSTDKLHHFVRKK